MKGPWEKGSEPPKPDKGQWYAGWQYDIDIKNANHVLDNLGKYYPGDGVRSGLLLVAGRQGSRQGEWYERYETNLLTLIKALEKNSKHQRHHSSARH